MVRRLVSTIIAMLVIVGCAGSASTQPAESTPPPAVTEPTSVPVQEAEAGSNPGPGGYEFDRSDPEAGVANIMAAFATDEATATCVFEAWGDVANLPPADLTPELMTFEICGTSILQMMTGSS